MGEGGLGCPHRQLLVALAVEEPLIPAH
eukprot:SAG22_NODE_16784_length_318_cov_0.474886_2_plen_27_part_01